MRRSAAGTSTHGLLVALVISGVAATYAVAPGAHAARPLTASEYAARLLDLVNQARALHGLHELQTAAGTGTVAASWTDRLAAGRALSHNPHLAHDLATHGSSSWRVYGENVGVGEVENPDDLFTAYMHSPEHRDNILTREYRYVGVAVVFAGNHAWNTFDFVDVYSSGSSTQEQPAGHGARPHPVHRVAGVGGWHAHVHQPQHASGHKHHRGARHGRPGHARPATQVDALQSHLTATKPVGRVAAPRLPAGVATAATNSRTNQVVGRQLSTVSTAAPVHRKVRVAAAPRPAAAATVVSTAQVVVASRMAAVSDVPPTPRRSGPALPAAVGFAVLALAFAARRWVLVVAAPAR